MNVEVMLLFHSKVGLRFYRQALGVHKYQEGTRTHGFGKPWEEKL